MAFKKQVPKDIRGGHVRIYWEILDSHAWHVLSWADIGLYVALRRKLKGTNNGNIEATLSDLKHAGITSSASLAKGLRALMAVGLLEKTRQGGIAAGGKVCSLYRFTDEPVLDHPKQGVKASKASNDWKRFSKHTEAASALRLAHQSALRPTTKERLKLQKLNVLNSATEPGRQFSASAAEHDAIQPPQFLNMSVPDETRLKPA